MKVILGISVLFGVLASPSAVAFVASSGQDSVSDGLRDLGIPGSLVVGILAIFWRIWKALQPRVYAWIDAGIAERSEMRGLARALKERFDDEDRKDREAMREAIAVLRQHAQPAGGSSS